MKLTFKRAGDPHAGRAVRHVLGDHIGYIPLQTFNENAAEEVEAAVGKLVKRGRQGVVLDLRDNGGGIVEQALAMSSCS